jgi:hypothetical protein
MGAVGGFDAGGRCDFTITMDLLCVGTFVGRITTSIGGTSLYQRFLRLSR